MFLRWLKITENFTNNEDNNIIYCTDQISLSISFTAIRARVRAIRVKVNPNSPNPNSRKRNRRTYLVCTVTGYFEPS